MSFALEYRKKMQARARAAEQERAARERANAGFVVTPPDENTDTRRTRRQVLAALSLAGIILSFFNSGSFVQYAGGLTDSSVGMRIIVAAEDWHSLMEKNRLTLVVEKIRGAVSHVRHSEWPDLASGLGLGPAYRQPEHPDAIAPVDRAIEEKRPDDREPDIEITRPAGPVMRASVR